MKNSEKVKKEMKKQKRALRRARRREREMERKLTNSSNKLLELKSKFNKDKVKVLKGSREKDGLIKQIIVYALLICIGFVYLYPILYMISNSLMNLEDLLDTSINWIPSKLYLDNYKKAALNMNYIGTFFQSIVVAGIPTILNVVVCSFVGYGFARFEFRGKKILMALLIFSYIIPPQITMMPTYVLYADLKLIWNPMVFVLGTVWPRAECTDFYLDILSNFSNKYRRY